MSCHQTYFLLLPVVRPPSQAPLQSGMWVGMCSLLLELVHRKPLHRLLLHFLWLVLGRQVFKMAEHNLTWARNKLVWGQCWPWRVLRELAHHDCSESLHISPRLHQVPSNMTFLALFKYMLSTWAIMTSKRWDDRRGLDCGYRNDSECRSKEGQLSYSRDVASGSSATT